MARDGHHRYRGVDDRIAEKVQAELGLLVVPLEQRPLGYLGNWRRRLCADCPSGSVGRTKHPWCC